MAIAEDKLKELDIRNLKAAALFETFTLKEMEEVLKTNIFDLLGVSGELTQEQKDDLLRVFQDTIENRAVARIFDSLSEAETAEFAKLLEEGAENAEKYLVEKGINKEQIAIVEMVLYKLELSNSKKVEGGVNEPG